MKKVFLMVFIAAAVAVAPAQERERTVRHDPQRPSLETYLGLTHAQLLTIEQMQKAQDDNLGPLINQMRKKQEDLGQAIERGDAAAAGRAQIELDTARRQTETVRKQLRDQVLASLTPDQQAKLNGLQEAARLIPYIEQAVRFSLLTAPEGVIRHEGGGAPGGVVSHTGRREDAGRSPAHQQK